MGNALITHVTARGAAVLVVAAALVGLAGGGVALRQMSRANGLAASTPAVSSMPARGEAVLGEELRESGRTEGRSEVPSVNLGPPDRLGKQASPIRSLPWWHWATWTDCVAELQLMEAYDLRYNTESGLPPEGAPALDHGWKSYIPLRFEIQNVFWCSEELDGFIASQKRQRFKRPDAEIVAAYEHPWWVREETLDSQPQGLAVVLFADGRIMDPPHPGAHYEWAYLLSLADRLSGDTQSYRFVIPSFWYEYDDGEAISLWPEARELPIADLLDEVHEALQLAGKK